jgi:hypothetical protein
MTAFQKYMNNNIAIFCTFHFQEKNSPLRWAIFHIIEPKRLLAVLSGEF